MSWLTTTANREDGAAFAPAEQSSVFFDALIARSVVLQSGVQRMTTTGASFTIPRILDNTTSVGWVAEGAEMTPADGDADLITATPRKLAVVRSFSNELLADASPSVREAMARSLANVFASKMDQGLLVGTGTPPEIRGIFEQTGNNTVAAGGPIEDFDVFVAAIAEAEAADARPRVVYMHPTVWAWISSIKDNTVDSNRPLVTPGAGSPTQAPSRSILGMPVFVSTWCPTDEVVVADPDQIYVIMRQELQLAFDRSAAFTSDSTLLRATIRVALTVNDPLAIVKITGVTQPTEPLPS